ncbi:hypothetical protein DC3_48170 [Deinococcus cellulosilyticus NBRC 106333 = KACC 11606]|uniref:Uncharacterized protein n=2 Tax=Deinococcus cellulosilyticus TaxID=401558 RepID=A0A511N8Q2_DEIC1|nr:hypothetical protein DC3_48170 [Deinococcus cellulosilyticus NBRC 106333 = KACC 11606]
MACGVIAHAEVLSLLPDTRPLAETSEYKSVYQLGHPKGLVRLKDMGDTLMVSKFLPSTGHFSTPAQVSGKLYRAYPTALVLEREGEGVLLDPWDLSILGSLKTTEQETLWAEEKAGWVVVWTEQKALVLDDHQRLLPVKLQSCGRCSFSFLQDQKHTLLVRGYTEVSSGAVQHIDEQSYLLINPVNGQQVHVPNRPVAWVDNLLFMEVVPSHNVGDLQFELTSVDTGFAPEVFGKPARKLPRPEDWFVVYPSDDGQMQVAAVAFFQEHWALFQGQTGPLYGTHQDLTHQQALPLPTPDQLVKTLPEAAVLQEVYHQAGLLSFVQCPSSVVVFDALWKTLTVYPENSKRRGYVLSDEPLLGQLRYLDACSGNPKTLYLSSDLGVLRLLL